MKWLPFETHSALKSEVRQLKAENERLRNRKPYIKTYKSYMSVADIKIRSSFEATEPSVDKLARCRAFYEANGYLDRDIIVDSNNTLLDGYIGYMTLRVFGVQGTKVLVVKAKMREGKA
jgi:hypothetical protein